MFNLFVAFFLVFASTDVNACVGINKTDEVGPDGYGKIIRVIQSGGERLSNDDKDQVILTNYKDNTLAIDENYTIEKALLLPPSTI